MKYRIKELREDKDLKHRELAKYLNISQSSYSDLENEKSQAKAEYLIKLALFYNTSIDYIVGLTNQNLPYPRANKSQRK